MGRLVTPGGKILAECLEYDPSLFGGMPELFLSSNCNS